MPVTDASMINWAQRKRRVFFVLTPLIDVMFLLLIFFMLSSQISPYALMPMGAVADATATTVDPTAVRQPATAPLTLRIASGTARIGGRDVPFDQLSEIARGLVEEGASGFLVLPSGSADAQDIISVLEILNSIDAGQVTLINLAGPAS